MACCLNSVYLLRSLCELEFVICFQKFLCRFSKAIHIDNSKNTLNNLSLYDNCPLFAHKHTCPFLLIQFLPFILKLLPTLIICFHFDILFFARLALLPALFSFGPPSLFLLLLILYNTFVCSSHSSSDNLFHLTDHRSFLVSLFRPEHVLLLFRLSIAISVYSVVPMIKSLFPPFMPLPSDSHLSLSVLGPQISISEHLFLNFKILFHIFLVSSVHRLLSAFSFRF